MLSVFVLEGSVILNDRGFDNTPGTTANNTPGTTADQPAGDDPGREAAGTAGWEDFIIVSDQDEWTFTAPERTSLFIIKTPSRPSYPTYAEKHLR
jgi:hypothetical protein